MKSGNYCRKKVLRSAVNKILKPVYLSAKSMGQSNSLNSHFITDVLCELNLLYLCDLMHCIAAAYLTDRITAQMSTSTFVPTVTALNFQICGGVSIITVYPLYIV